MLQEHLRSNKCDPNIKHLTCQQGKWCSYSAPQLSMSQQDRQFLHHYQWVDKQNQVDSLCTLLTQLKSKFQLHSSQSQTHPCLGIFCQLGTLYMLLHFLLSKNLADKYIPKPPWKTKLVHFDTNMMSIAAATGKQCWQIIVKVIRNKFTKISYDK